MNWSELRTAVGNELEGRLSALEVPLGLYYDAVPPTHERLYVRFWFPFTGGYRTAYEGSVISQPLLQVDVRHFPPSGSSNTPEPELSERVWDAVRLSKVPGTVGLRWQPDSRATLSREKAEELRRKMADGLFASFSERIQDTRDSDHLLAMTSDGLVLKCPVGVWVDFKLAQLWRNNIPLQECEQCGSIFAPLRKSVKYCKGGGCRDENYRERKTKAKQ